MASTQRQQLLTRLQKQLKQHFKPIVPDVGRPVLEQVLFACCLENAGYDVAEKAFARLGESFFDYNEVRVTTVNELGETLKDLPLPQRSALGLRRVLQAVFESSYSFSLEHARKQSIAAGIKSLEQLHGIPPFVVSFVASTCLGGHMIPLDDGALAGLYLAGVIDRNEYDAGKVPWLERMISKKQGMEFSSQLHQLGAEIFRNVHSPQLRKLFLTIDPHAKDRLPKRGEPMAARNPPPEPQGKDAKKAADAAEELRPAGPQAASRPAGKTPMPSPAPKTGKPGPKPFVVKPNVGRPITIKPQVTPVEVPQQAGSPPVSAAGRPSKGSARSTEKGVKPAGGSKTSGSPKPPAKAASSKASSKPSVGSGKKAGAESRASSSKSASKPIQKSKSGAKAGMGSKAGRRGDRSGGKSNHSRSSTTGRKAAVAELSKKKPR